MTGALALIASAALNARSSEGVEVLRDPRVAELRQPVADAAASGVPRPSIRTCASSSRPRTRTPTSRAAKSTSTCATAPVKWGDLHVETIFEEEILPLVSPALLKRGRSCGAREQLLGQPLIFSDVNVVQWPRWFAAHGVPLSPATYALRFDRAYLVIEAAVQGLRLRAREQSARRVVSQER